MCIPTDIPTRIHWRRDENPVQRDDGICVDIVSQVFSMTPHSQCVHCTR